MIEYLLKNRDKIIKKMKKINNIDYKEVEEKWILDSFENPKDMSFAGGDGSCNKLDYISFSFYGVGAVSFVHNIGEKVKKAKEEYIFDITHPLDIEDRMRKYMLTLELKNALYVLRNYDIDCYIFDGSLFSLLISSDKEDAIFRQETSYNLFCPANNPNTIPDDIIDYIENR